MAQNQELADCFKGAYPGAFDDQNLPKECRTAQYKSEINDPAERQPAFALWGCIPHVFQVNIWERIYLFSDDVVSPLNGWSNKESESQFWMWTKNIILEFLKPEDQPPTVERKQKERSSFLKIGNKRKHMLVEPWEELGDILQSVISFDLPTIYRGDPYMFTMIVNAFYGRGASKAKDLLDQCKAGLHAVLITFYVHTRTMEQSKRVHSSHWQEKYERYKRVTDDELVNRYSEGSNVWDTQGTELWQRFRKESGARSCLTAQLCPEFLLRTWQKEAQKRPVDVEFLAYKAKAKKILSHEKCQQRIEKRWDENSSMPIMCIPYSTRTKFKMHWMAQFIYVLMFINVLIKKPTTEVHWREIIIIMFQLTHLLDLLTYLLYTKLSWTESHSKLDLAYNAVNVVDMLLYYGNKAFCERFSDTYLVVDLISNVLYHVSFVLATIVLMRFSTKYEQYGTILQVLKKSLMLCFRYLPVFAMLWIIYATLHISITERHDSKDNSIIWFMMQTGVFEIFGGVTNSNDYTGKIEVCNETISFGDLKTIPQLECAIRQSLVPILLFIYMLLANIMLVNLLTAMLSQEFEKIRSESTLQWKYDNYRLLIMYKSMSKLPPPLTLIVYLMRVIEVIVYSCWFAVRWLLAQAGLVYYGEPGRPPTYQPITRRWSRLWPTLYDPLAQTNVSVGTDGITIPITDANNMRLTVNLTENITDGPEMQPHPSFTDFARYYSVGWHADGDKPLQ